MTAPVGPHPPVPFGLRLVVGLGIVFGVVALALAVQSSVENVRQNDRRENDRITSDITACERGNALRQQIIDYGSANETTIAKILDLVFGSSDQTAEVTALRRQLDVPLAELHEAVAAIELIDCQAAVPGAREEP